MSVLGTISLSGLSITNSDYVLAGEVEVTNSLIVDNGATITLPNHSISDSALSTNVMLLNATQDSTGNKSFSTSSVDVAPVSINYTGLPNQQVQFCACTTPSTFNPYCDASSCYIGGTGDLVVGKQDRFNAIRFTDLSMNLFADTEMILTVNDAPVIDLTQTEINTYMQLFSNYDSLTEYENQFLGDIWSAKGVTSKNGFYVQNNITPGSTTYAVIDSTGNAQLESVSCTTANITTITTTTQAVADNSTKAATTAFVKSQNYITAAALTGYAQLSGVPQTFSNANTFSQSVTGVTEATADNSTKLASTAFVKNQGYAILNASNSFTGNQQLTNAGTNAALRIKSSTATTTREGYHFVSTSGGSFNSVVQANDYVIMGRDSSTMDLGVLCLTTHSSTSCGIRITNANVLMTGTTIQTNGTLQANNAITASGTVTTNGTLAINNAVTGPSTSYATTSANIGYVNTITSFTTPTGTGINVLGTYIFDNGANYAYGTYQIVANIRATTATAGVSIRIAWQTTTTVITGTYGDSLATISVGPNILRIVATLKIYSTQTWYLLFQCGTTFTFNGAACSLDIIRIA